MEKKLVISFGDYKIIAEIDDSNMPDIPPEMCIYLMNDEQQIAQDICLVRPHYGIKHDDNCIRFETDVDKIDCIVWGDSGNDDYTDKHVINVYREE